jgi:hypothetical protein
MQLVFLSFGSPALPPPRVTLPPGFEVSFIEFLAKSKYSSTLAQMRT